MNCQGLIVIFYAYTNEPSPGNTGLFTATDICERNHCLPTPNPSQEGDFSLGTSRIFPSWEGSGMDKKIKY